MIVKQTPKYHLDVSVKQISDYRFDMGVNQTTQYYFDKNANQNSHYHFNENANHFDVNDKPYLSSFLSLVKIGPNTTFFGSYVKHTNL